MSKYFGLVFILVSLLLSACATLVPARNPAATEVWNPRSVSLNEKVDYRISVHEIWVGSDPYCTNLVPISRGSGVRTYGGPDFNFKTVFQYPKDNVFGWHPCVVWVISKMIEVTPKIEVEAPKGGIRSGVRYFADLCPMGTSRLPNLTVAECRPNEDTEVALYFSTLVPSRVSVLAPFQPPSREPKVFSAVLRNALRIDPIAGDGVTQSPDSMAVGFKLHTNIQAVPSITDQTYHIEFAVPELSIVDFKQQP